MTHSLLLVKAKSSTDFTGLRAEISLKHAKAKLTPKWKRNTGPRHSASSPVLVKGLLVHDAQHRGSSTLSNVDVSDDVGSG